MASEFVRRVRHVEDINTFSKSVLEEGDLVLTNDNKMYALIGQEFKQLDNMEKVWATSEAGKYLMVGDDGIVKPMVIDNILGKDNTFTGSNIFNRPISANGGLNGSLIYNTAPLKDLNTIITTSQYKIDASYSNIPNSLPNGAFLYTLNFDSNLVYQVIISRDISNPFTKATIWTRLRISNSWGDWESISKDNNSLHKSGNETVSGDKTFNGQTTLLNGNFGLRVTNTGILKTTDAGNTWTAL